MPAAGQHASADTHNKGVVRIMRMHMQASPYTNSILAAGLSLSGAASCACRGQSQWDHGQGNAAPGQDQPAAHAIRLQVCQAAVRDI